MLNLEFSLKLIFYNKFKERKQWIYLRILQSDGE